MKKIAKIKLTKLSENNLEERQMKELRGGGYCSDGLRCNCGQKDPCDCTSSSFNDEV